MKQFSPGRKEEMLRIVTETMLVNGADFEENFVSIRCNSLKTSHVLMLTVLIRSSLIFEELVQRSNGLCHYGLYVIT